MLTFRQAVWLFPLSFVLHVLEEWTRFPSWANRYASARYTRREYVIIHLVGIAGALIGAGIMSWLPDRPLVFVFFAFLFVPATLWNALFHAGATMVFRSYCPGVVTAMIVYPLVFYLVSERALREGFIGIGSWTTALAIAAAFHVWEVRHNVFKA